MTTETVTSSLGVLIFSTDNTHLYQCDTTEQFTLVFFGQKVVFRFCELIVFKSKIRKIDLFNLFNTDVPDIELIHLPHCDRFFALSTLQILELRELFSGSFAMMELNSIIQRRIVRKAL
ncbi:hypothetical protein FNH22_29590 [Fulvivirga sp. M361]|uniref:hypothetical protein n=1 Tax=Fulvivirga sp. M361 TaxID=2594266 RepID=UPI00117AD72B|nr:hypothetical protein [Fulvivirga sp. M361]TRX48209.1 hypothetical protein FNH22_29590 [Fulvivirga sp. M361]